MSLKGLGEFGLIEIIKSRVGDTGDAVGIGDDCAIVECGDREFLISVDALVENVHFFENTDSYLLGRKSLAVNMSDIAAMAASPKWAFLSMTVGKSVSLEWIDRFIDGFLSLANEFGVVLLGGDTTKGKDTVINITIVGENKRGESVKRSGAQPGGIVVVSGRVGCSFAGFKALQDGLEGYEELKMKHLNPTPRVKEALSIKDIAQAMIDISDGLIQDLGHIADSSGVAIDIFWDKIPFCEVDFVKKEEMLCWGEDYEIAAVVKADATVPEGFYAIGMVKKGRGVRVIKEGRIIKIENCGYKHF